MAINLNLEKYGNQFRAFVNFANANANDADTLACIGGDAPGGLLDPEGNVRAIVAKTDDDKIKRFKHNLLFSRNDDQKALNNAVRDLFKETVLKVCGVGKIEDLPPSVRAVMRKGDYGVNGGHPLSVRRILAVTRAIKALADEPFTVGGNSKAAAEAKDIVKTKLATFHGSKREKTLALKNKMDNLAKALFSMSFVQDMQDLQDGKDSQFKKDHTRLIVAPKFKIGNQTLTFDNDTRLEEKNDIIAKFVTQDMNATYANLAPRDLKKAYAVMVMVAQHFAISMQNGAKGGLSTGQAAEAPFGIGQPDRKTENSPLTFSFNDNGSMHIGLMLKYDDPQVILDTKVGKKTVQKLYQWFDAGTSVTFSADVEITAQELEKIVETDYSKFDFGTVSGARQGQPDEDEAVAEAMGEFALGEGFKVSVSFSVVLNGGDVATEREL